MADTDTVTHAFRKDWGAEYDGEGQARFRIWAPGQELLSLRLEDEDHPMRRDANGWFELLVSEIVPGARYGFVLADGRVLPDPASRAQAGDVHARSVVVDPSRYRWRNPAWRGRPWPEAVVYELHVGTFTAEGTFQAAAGRLRHLLDLGITAVQLMPVGQFSGQRGWGYDGVLPYAPHVAYGTPDDLKHLVDEAHGLGLMIMLDVVYNHFGPDGNYLPTFAPGFFDETRHTPWGAGIAYDRAPVRRFFIDNAVYWLEEFQFDGLRLDAVDQIRDATEPELLVELAERVRQAFPGRHVHLVTEDNRNVTHLHERRDGRAARYTAEWNDDFHNAAHVVLTGETEGYYEDFAADAHRQLARCLAQGYAFQGEPSAHGGGKPRGEPSAHLPTTAFIDFLQNHDQVGNRALGDRLCTQASGRALDAMTAILLLSPHIPLLFMGEEWGETRPFYFFTDYTGDLAEAVREGRRGEFAAFSAFGSLQSIPDPNAKDTFEGSKLDWGRREEARGRARMRLYADLLSVRRNRIVPLLDDTKAAPGQIMAPEDGLLAIDWTLRGGTLQLRAALRDKECLAPPVSGTIIHVTGNLDAGTGTPLHLPPWAVVAAIEE